MRRGLELQMRRCRVCTCRSHTKCDNDVRHDSQLHVKRTLTSLLAFAVLASGCNSDESLKPPPHGSQPLTVLGNGQVQDRFTGEVWVVGDVAYTTTWGNRGAPGNAVKIWDVSGNVPK